MTTAPTLVTKADGLHRLTAAKGRVMIAFVPNGWGKGYTAEQAMQAATRHMASIDRGSKYTVLVFDADGDATVDGYGCLYTPAHCEGPIKVAELQRTRR